MSARLAVALLCALLASCQRTNVVRLEYLGVQVSRGGPTVTGLLGFTCTDGATGPGTALGARLVAAGSGCLVLDVYTVDATPAPEASETACSTFDVTTDPQGAVARYTRAIDAAAVDACRSETDPRGVVRCVLAGVSGATATPDAPDGLIVLRSVLLSGACPGQSDDIATARRVDLVGCAYTCPTILDDVAGPVLLYLPVDATACTQSSAEMANCLALPAPTGGPSMH